MFFLPRLIALSYADRDSRYPERFGHQGPVYTQPSAAVQPSAPKAEAPAAPTEDAEDSVDEVSYFTGCVKLKIASHFIIT